MASWLARMGYSHHWLADDQLSEAGTQEDSLNDPSKHKHCDFSSLLRER
jgi:hypothetical protein